jgi:hypothetical protein
MKKHPLYTIINSPLSSRRQINRLHEKALTNSKLYHPDDSGITMSDVYFGQNKLIRALKKDTKSKRFNFHCLKPHKIKMQKKERIVFIPPIVDKIIQSSFYEYFISKMTGKISPSVYSYQKGKTATDAIKAISYYLKWQYDNTNKHPDLYLFHSDISQYTDSIPVHDKSPVWPILKRMVVEEECEELPDYIWKLIVEMIRPMLTTETGNLYYRSRGIPTGTMMTTVMANLYLRTIDKYLEKIPGGFYARYGDDIVFMHPHHVIFSKAVNTLYRMLTKLGLVLNDKKTEYIYLTAGAIRHPTIPFTPANQITFLGYTIKVNGDISYPKVKVRRLLSVINRRIHNVASFSVNKTIEEKGPIIVASINQLIDSNSKMQHPSMINFYRVVTDRSQLRQIDYLIRQKIATALSGIKGVKAFQKISPYTLCQEWGLLSLERMINNSRHKNPLQID